MINLNIKITRDEAWMVAATPYKALRIIRHEKSDYDQLLAQGYKWTDVSFAFAQQLINELKRYNMHGVAHKVLPLLQEWVNSREAQFKNNR